MAFAAYRIDGEGLTNPKPTLVHGPSSALAEARRACERAATGDSSVLLIGEPGTGKEALARFVHGLSARARGPFVPVSCAALPEAALEVELFGHVAGAMAGVSVERRGKIASAHGGTLFLDEITALPMALQGRLVRLLQDRSFEPIGGNAQIPADLRLVAANDRDLLPAVDAGRFRRDLYYTICVCPIRVPSLRERREDVPLLFQHFWHARGETRAVDPTVVQRLCEYQFPGNVRELESLVGRIALCTDRAEVKLADLPADLFAPLSGGDPPRPEGAAATFEYPGFPKVPIALPLDLPTVLRALENAFIDTALTATANNKKEAAQLLGMGRTTLVEKLRRRAAERRRAKAEPPESR